MDGDGRNGKTTRDGCGNRSKRKENTIPDSDGARMYSNLTVRGCDCDAAL